MIVSADVYSKYQSFQACTVYFKWHVIIKGAERVICDVIISLL